MVVLVVVVVESEPPPGPEFDPEEPPSWPEVVEVLALPLLPSVVGWVTTVASPETSWLLPDEPSPEDVPRAPLPLPEPDVCEPESCVRDCFSVE